MVSLVDIGPSLDTVELRGKTVEINGLTAEHIVGVLISFPEVRKILASKEADLGILIAQSPLAISRMIAAGTGKADDNPTIQFARNLGVGEQYEIMSKIFELTFPKGLQSFLDGVGAALKSVGAPGWDLATKLPAPSSVASKEDAPSETAGTAPQSSLPLGANS
jgi:hypothetical protein